RDVAPGDQRLPLESRHAAALELMHPRLFPDATLAPSARLLIGVGITTVAWLTVTFLTRPADRATLYRFYARVQPGGPGWARVVEQARAEGITLPDPERTWTVPEGILAMVAGSFAVYAALFSIGNLIYGRYLVAAALLMVAIAASIFVLRVWGRVSGAETSREEEPIHAAVTR
ncbi:MAG TPA: hypothetical protein VGR27_04490, partial [Longimicrobiaceae bacterium]|nr:hypothetical protein [Longimicrobiaceae bacterium]